MEKFRLEKKKQHAALKVKKTNKVAHKLLENKISCLKNDFNRETKQLTKQTRFIEKELKEINSEEHTDNKLVLPPLTVSSSTTLSTSTTSVRTADEQPISENSQTDEHCPTCRFGTYKNIQCTHFPCYLPKTYHTIGFQLKPKSYSVLSNYKELLRRSHELRPTTRGNSRADICLEESEKEHRSPRLTARDKERGLKQLIKEMRDKNEKNRPPNWATNYGKPLPRRMVLKTVVPIENSII